MMWKGDASTHARYVDRSLLVKMGWSISINPSKIFLLFYNKKPTFSVLHDYFAKTATSDHLLYTLFPLNNNIFLFYFYSFPTSQVRTLSLSLFLLFLNRCSLSQIWKISDLSNQLSWFIFENQISLPNPPWISTWKSYLTFSCISLNLLLIIDLKFMWWIL